MCSIYWLHDPNKQYTQVDDTKEIVAVMLMYNLIEYSNSYSKISGSLWQYCKDTPALYNNGGIANFNEANVTDSFNFKGKITGQGAQEMIEQKMLK